MPEQKYDPIYELISERQDTALKRTLKNKEYVDLCNHQKSSEKSIENLYKKHLEKSEQIEIREHYEREIERRSYELNDIYLQGLRDAFKLLLFLSETDN
ncbi:MAG: hypothetical protein FWG90_11985 [Oscillospiraceae bacterium]|nr:hypothetical protein [Oscillospiraceae bacterium]